MKVAVTGASGFVGRHVIAALADYPVEVVAVTRSSAKLRGLLPTARIVEMDISQEEADAYHRLGNPDVLIHLAWDGLPNYRSLHHFEVELPRQYQFLKNMIDAGLPSLLVTGTCFEYGMQSGVLSEDRRPEPNNPYGYAKNALREQIEFFRRNKALNLTWARLFYMYGEDQAISSIYPQLKQAVSRGDSIFNMSGGEQLRDYLPVVEVAQQLVKLAMLQNDIGVVNICSGNPISVRRLVEQWVKENSWNIALNLGHYPYPDYEPMAFWGSRDRLDSLLKS